MNPPSALYGAMNKERKPFTYTPGGLDLSQIKSEKMAQRLMRNAMSQGVPEVPVQTIHSPPVQISSAIPNFNCLPVQVFPTFPLPANPKSLLRTRSNPDPTKETSINAMPSTSLLVFDDKSNSDTRTNINKAAAHISNNNSNNINECLIKSDYKTELSSEPLFQSMNWGNDRDQFLVKSNDAKYFALEPKEKVESTQSRDINSEDISSSYKTILDSNVNIDKKSNHLVLTTTSSQEKTSNNSEQKEVKVVKKQTKTEKKEEQNGDTEAEIVVKLPAKKSSAKTETNVEVLKKTLPDGTIEEVKVTTTKTTIDGKTEIKTETETRIFPKEETEGEVEVEEEEEEYEDEVSENNANENNEEVIIKEPSKSVKEPPAENGEKAEDEDEVEFEEEIGNKEVKENGHIITNEEKVETSTTKKVTIIQSADHDSGEEEEEVVEEVEEEEVEEEDGDVNVEQVVILKRQEDKESKLDDVENSDAIEDTKTETREVEQVEEQEEIEEDKDSENIEEDQETNKGENNKDLSVDHNEVEEVEVEEETDINEQENEKVTLDEKDRKDEDAEEEYEEAEDVQIVQNEADEKVQNTDSIENKESEQEDKIIEPSQTESLSEEALKEPDVGKEESPKVEQSKEEHIHKIILQPEPKVSFREPSIPLDKVEDVEIKPIAPAQEVIKKCHTEIITTTKDVPTGALSTQTEYNRIENIVTVNRSTKTLDHAYEQQPDRSIPTVKTYFVPHNDRILSTPQPISRPYQPIYTPEPQTERRHSLLLDRISVERQIPVQHTDIYQNNYTNQSYEQNQWSQEPQSEVLTVSNVKPSTITKNQQWYQQTKTETSNIVTPKPVMPSQLWSQSQTQVQAQPPQQPQSQVPQYQSYAPPQNVSKPDFQPSYIDNSNQNSFKTNIQQNTYPSYTPKPSWVSSTFDAKPAPAVQPNQYSTFKKDSTESYLKSTQQLSSSYVPPPWEQDSNYIAENQNYYQPPPTIVYTPNETWKPKPSSKFTKPAPTSYIPPAPNQSFVKPVTNADLPKQPGRKTYYSEYERRYISVPETTYIPSETKYQAQPDPSPQYYFDNNEPAEVVEPQWRRELREFTEKTSQTTVQTEKTSVRPPWEEDSKYAVPEYTATATPTPTWTQTLKPRSWRERSFEPEYIGSKEWPKTNTLGRGRPQSSYIKSNVDTIPERTRGVSVDRYNPNNYQSPPTSEHPPVQSYTLNPNAFPKTYQNPNVPAYHSRASAEPREHPSPYAQPRPRENRIPPVQSRSFKYLQWITGTED